MRPVLAGGDWPRSSATIAGHVPWPGSTPPSGSLSSRQERGFGQSVPPPCPPGRGRIRGMDQGEGIPTERIPKGSSLDGSPRASVFAIPEGTHQGRAEVQGVGAEAPDRAAPMHGPFQWHFPGKLRVRKGDQVRGPLPLRGFLGTAVRDHDTSGHGEEHGRLQDQDLHDTLFLEGVPVPCRGRADRWKTVRMRSSTSRKVATTRRVSNAARMHPPRTARATQFG